MNDAAPDPFRPQALAQAGDILCLGLIADTHHPERLVGLPEDALATAFQGVDLILHAGDVGDLSTLDELAALAPVIAVHGNDDDALTTRELPAQQLAALRGQRLMLHHGNRAKRSADLAARRVDAWAPKLAWWAEHARRAGASIFVFGHTHVPMARRVNGVFLVNPGALAPGNEISRQLVQTVARLYLSDDSVIAVHVNLARPGAPYAPEVDWEAGFTATARRYQGSLVAPDLEPYLPALYGHQWQQPRAMRPALLPLAHRCWAGEQEHISHADVLAQLPAMPLAAADRAALRAILEGPVPDAA